MLEWLSTQENLVKTRAKAFDKVRAASKSAKQQQHIQQNAALSSSGSPGVVKERSSLRSWYRMFKPPPPDKLSVSTTFTRRENGSTATSFHLVPGIGTYFFIYKGAWIQVERTRERTMIDLKSGSPWETITLKTLSMDRHLFDELLEEARKDALAKEEGKTVIFTSYGPDWRPFGNPRRRRPMTSVILDKGISDLMLADIRRFLNNGAWYHQRGIPHRRGYLLYGPPGSGKTSFIQALAGELEYNICVLNLSERSMTDDRLAHLLCHAPPRSLILLEDVDAAFGNRLTEKEIKQGFTNLVTFSGLLNALDGVASSEERIIFMTTNHAEKLDPALIRPGRVDVKQYIGDASPDQIRRMFLRFFEGKEDLAEEFVAVVEKRGMTVSCAQLQGYFVIHSEDPRRAIDNVGQLFAVM
ncbi:hypothetical protein HK102_003616 [Quaeritorhiza haematococci]|nr:hypothetical protein HK102_003616 [Quaeritorhiza haematococci]